MPSQKWWRPNWKKGQGWSRPVTGLRLVQSQWVKVLYLRNLQKSESKVVLKVCLKWCFCTDPILWPTTLTMSRFSVSSFRAKNKPHCNIYHVGSVANSKKMWDQGSQGWQVSQWYVYPRDMCTPTHISLVICVSPPKWRPVICVSPTPLPSTWNNSILLRSLTGRTKNPNRLKRKFQLFSCWKSWVCVCAAGIVFLIITGALRAVCTEFKHEH